MIRRKNRKPKAKASAQMFGRGRRHCGKIGYETRKLARQVSKRTPGQKGKSLREYLCDECGFWHLGHLPPGVTSGEFSSKQMYG